MVCLNISLLTVLYLLVSVDGECGDPPIVEAASSCISGDPPYPEGTNVSYSCGVGFKPEGQATCTCTACDWGVRFECRQVYCEQPTDPEHGRVVNNQTFIPGVTANFECEPGFTMQGPSSQSCLDDGRWSPSELPVCQIKSCGPFPPVSNGALIQSNPNGEENVYGSSVTVTCNSGFILNGRKTSRCNEFGLWESPYPSCDPVSCGHHPGVNGSCVQRTHFVSNTLYMVCKEHATLVGGADRATNCDPSTALWEDPSFGCKCDCRVDESYGVVTGNIVDGYIKHGSVLQWNCSGGENSTESTPRCSDGVIEPPPVCLEYSGEVDKINNEMPIILTCTVIAASVIVLIVLILFVRIKLTAHRLAHRNEVAKKDPELCLMKEVMGTEKYDPLLEKEICFCLEPQIKAESYFLKCSTK